MKKTILLLFSISIFSSLDSKGQDFELISNNLFYINEQFHLYNDYNTSWAIDFNTKEIYCFDKFGSYNAKISDVFFENKDGNSKLLNFKCISGNCIKESNTNKELKKSYSMGLSKNLSVVISKLNEISSQFSNNYKSTIKNNSKKYSEEIKENVKDILNQLTNIFQTENKYKHKWFVNWSENYIYSKTNLCEVHIPLGKNIEIEKTDGGYKFLSNEEIIREKCTSFDNLTKKTNNTLKTENAKDEVIYLFREILYLTK